MTFQLTPQLATFIPLFYVAWSDAVLSPSEVVLIQDKIKQFKWLSEDDKDQLMQCTLVQFSPF